MYQYQNYIPYVSNQPVVVDRNLRDKLPGVIQQNLCEQITVNEFDTAIEIDYVISADSTVEFVSLSILFYLSNLFDDEVRLSKSEWLFFQRLLLLLESDFNISIISTRRWSWTQLVAVTFMIISFVLIWHFGWGLHLLAFSIPLGVGSMLITLVRNKAQSVAFETPHLAPFSSFSDLLAAYKSTPSFRMGYYPGNMLDRKICTPLSELVWQLPLCAAWLMFSPVLLFIQMFPMTDTKTSVNVINQTS